jgi:hypothetical protein
MKRTRKKTALKNRRHTAIDSATDGFGLADLRASRDDSGFIVTQTDTHVNDFDAIDRLLLNSGFAHPLAEPQSRVLLANSASVEQLTAVDDFEPNPAAIFVVEAIDEDGHLQVHTADITVPVKCHEPLSSAALPEIGDAQGRLEPLVEFADRQDTPCADGGQAHLDGLFDIKVDPDQHETIPAAVTPAIEPVAIHITPGIEPIADDLAPPREWTLPEDAAIGAVVVKPIAEHAQEMANDQRDTGDECGLSYSLSDREGRGDLTNDVHDQMQHKPFEQGIRVEPLLTIPPENAQQPYPSAYKPEPTPMNVITLVLSVVASLAAMVLYFMLMAMKEDVLKLNEMVDIMKEDIQMIREELPSNNDGA